jgi:acetylornithine deacetylase/succinyl-diaminopimelate desuccinylase-like protein
MNDILTLIQDLINIDTTRATMNEMMAVRYLSRYFRQWQVSHRCFEPFAGRGSIVACIPGEEKESILLLSHLDTENEQAPGGYTPARAVVAADRVMGRGALDCKGNVAVLAQIIKTLRCRNRRPWKTILFAAVAGEEDGGQAGAKWLIEHTDAFDRVNLVIGEGGGYPVPCQNQWYFTLQTGEMGETQNETHQLSLDPGALKADYERAFRQGFYDENTLHYIETLPTNHYQRHIPAQHFWQGLGKYLEEQQNQCQPWTGKKRQHLAFFQRELEKLDPSYRTMPFITPGYSDNRFFRERGIETWGFFPLDPRNSLRGIHGANEYITIKSLQLAYTCLSAILEQLARPDS